MDYKQVRQGLLALGTSAQRVADIVDTAVAYAINIVDEAEDLVNKAASKPVTDEPVAETPVADEPVASNNDDRKRKTRIAVEHYYGHNSPGVKRSLVDRFMKIPNVTDSLYDSIPEAERNEPVGW